MENPQIALATSQGINKKGILYLVSNQISPPILCKTKLNWKKNALSLVSFSITISIMKKNFGSAFLRVVVSFQRSGSTHNMTLYTFIISPIFLNFLFCSILIGFLYASKLSFCVQKLQIFYKASLSFSFKTISNIWTNGSKKFENTSDVIISFFKVI